MAAVAAPARAPRVLFDDPRFHALNLAAGERSITVPFGDAGTLGGVLDARGHFTAGHSAPYGGPSLDRLRETPSRLEDGLDAALAALHEEGARDLRLKLFPPSLAPEDHAALQVALVQRGFAMEDCDLAFVVPLGGLAAGRDAFRRAGRRALAALDAQAFTFGPVPVAEGWPVIAANRAAKGYDLALDGAYVARAQRAFPERIEVLGLRRGAHLCAAALVYAAAPGHRLVVHWGDEPAGDGPSPMALLAAHVLDHALAAGDRVLDLGGATHPGRPRTANAGLVQFKRAIGGYAEARPTFTR